MTERPEEILFDFRQPAHAGVWQTVNDGVMGGVSTSRFELRKGGGAVFSGEISLEHDGGFASARSQPGLFDLHAFSALAIAVRGDGRQYRLTFRSMPAFDYVLYQARFTATTGARQEHRFQWSDFAPTFRGLTLADAPPPDLARVASIGFLIADRQAGPFHLECEWIKAIRGTV